MKQQPDACISNDSRSDDQRKGLVLFVVKQQYNLYTVIWIVVKFN